MTPERLSALLTLFHAYQTAVHEVTAEVEGRYGRQDGPPPRWMVDVWGELYEGRPEVQAMWEADAAMPSEERASLAEMAGAPVGRLQDLLWVLEHRQVH